VHRGSLTVSEARLWASLRGSRLGVGFRRQFVVGRYIADFCVPVLRLVVEVDGAITRSAGARMVGGTGICAGWGTGSCGCRMRP
jgi:very-short-patch-repair endonuclease